MKTAGILLGALILGFLGGMAGYRFENRQAAPLNTKKTNAFIDKKHWMRDPERESRKSRLHSVGSRA
jgi:hypothetical protein